MSFNGIVQVEVLDVGGRNFLVFPRSQAPAWERTQHVLFGKSVAPAKC